MLTRRQAIRLAALSGASAALGAGCADREERARSTSDVVARRARTHKRLELRMLYPKGSAGNLAPVVERFGRMSGHRVQLIEGTLEEIAAEVVLDHRLGRDLFDIALPATYGIPDLVEAGAIRSIDDFAARHEPEVIGQGELYTLGDFYKGKRYGYQADGDAIVMSYNQAWLDDPRAQERYRSRFGSELQVAQTWAELDQQMAFFHRPEQGTFGGALFRHPLYIAWEYWVRLHALGVFPVADDLHPRFTSDPGVEALEQMVAATAWQEPSAATNDLFDNFQAFGRGHAFANIGWGGTQKFLNSPDCPMRGNLRYGVIPGGNLGGATLTLPYFNWGWTYVIANRARDPELAYLFTLFASTPQMSTLAVREPSGYFDPHRVEHYADEKVQAIYGQPFLDVHRQSMENVMPDFYLRGRGRYFSALQHAVASACRGQVAPRRALEQLQGKWEEITEAIGRDGQREQWMALKASYPGRLRAKLK